MQHPYDTSGLLTRRQVMLISASLMGAALGGCDDSTGNEAIDAYEGIDPALDRMLQLGFVGFNAASGDTLPEQLATGAASGSMVVNGKVSVGNAVDRDLRLTTLITNYSDGPAGPDALAINYNATAVIIAEMTMTGLPDATLTGTITGTIGMSGELTGTLTLDLTITGQTEEDANGDVQIKTGTLHLSGSASSQNGLHTVDVTR